MLEESTQGNLSGVTEIIDVGVYREITNGGNPAEGMSALNAIIAEEEGQFRGSVKTRMKPARNYLNRWVR